MKAIFRDTKEFIGYCPKVPPNIKYYKDLGENFNVQTHFWEGNFDNGQIKKIDEKKVDEFTLENEYINKIKSLYRSEISHLITIKQLDKIAKHLDLYDEEFKEMINQISPLMEFYQNMIEKLKAEHKLESKKEIYEKHKGIL